MTGYNIHLTNNDPLTTINVKTIDDRSHSSLVLIGQGIPNYGTDIAQDFVWLMENFSNGTAPVHPLVGQEWHDNILNRLNVYLNGGEWQPLLTPLSSFASKFDMLSAAANIDFSITQSVAIFTAPDTTRKYLPNFLVLVPNGTVTATTAPIMNLTASATGDVMAATSVTIGAVDQFVRFAVGPLVRAATITHPTITLNIVTAATGGALHYDAYLFGLVL